LVLEDGEDSGVPEDANICLHEDLCNVMGRNDGRPFAAPCWEDPAEGEDPVQPDDVDAATWLAEMEDFITKETVNWDSANNLIVSPRFNYQDGWYILNDEFAEVNPGKWDETDKAVDNRCYLDDQCDPGFCCGTWPDQNNRREPVSNRPVSKDTDSGQDGVQLSLSVRHQESCVS